MLLITTNSVHATDCDSNGFDDPADIVGGTSVDANSNGVPDECDIVIGVDFNGPDDVRRRPADPTVAVGNQRIVATVNTSVFLYDKSGTLLESSILADDDDFQLSPGFFEEVGAQLYPFDPRTIYDQYAGRFLVTTLENFGSATCIDIAISRSSNPSDLSSASWHKYRLNGLIDHQGMPLTVDFHGLGVDEHAVYVATNVFVQGYDLVGSLIRVIDKAALLAGLPALREGLHYHDFILEDIYIIHPAHNFGNAPAAFFLSADCTIDQNCAADSFHYFTITGPVGAPVLTQATLTVPAFESPRSLSGYSDVPDGDGVDGIDGSDGGLHSAVWRNGRLYTAHSIELDGKRVVRWYAFDTAACAVDPGDCLVQFGDVDAGLSPLGNPRYTFFPAVAVNRCDQLGMVMALSSDDDYPGVFVTGRNPDDLPGVTPYPAELKAGESDYSHSLWRWGDYFGIGVDPADGATFWGIGEYAVDPQTWNTHIASFSVHSNGLPVLCDDCNTNGLPDDQDITAGTSIDCNTNGLPDECETYIEHMGDCNTNGIPDACELPLTSPGGLCVTGCIPDCDANGVPDECDLDCNTNGTTDACEIAAGTGSDCNSNGVPDDCELDCNANGVADDCELAMGVAQDCNANGLLDLDCEIVRSLTIDCNGNGVPDECEFPMVAGAYDASGGILPENAVPSWNKLVGTDAGISSDGLLEVNDASDTTFGRYSRGFGSADFSKQSAVFEFSGQVVSASSPSGAAVAWSTGFWDGRREIELAVAVGTIGFLTAEGGKYITGCSAEVDTTQGTPMPEYRVVKIKNHQVHVYVNDEYVFTCDYDSLPGRFPMRVLLLGTSTAGTSSFRIGFMRYAFGTTDMSMIADDCNANGIPDDCDLADGTSRDCNFNLTPDECDIGGGTSFDCNGNVVPDECELCLNDCNINAIPDDCDISAGTSADANANAVPDSCEDCNTNGVLDFNEDCDSADYAFRHDYDRDGDSDLEDFAYFQRCVDTNGVGMNGATLADCLCAFDWDTNGQRDGNVDSNDFLAYLDALENSGPAIACWYAAEGMDYCTGSGMAMMMGGGGQGMLMSFSIAPESEQILEAPAMLTADLSLEVQPLGGGTVVEKLEPDTSYELHYTADCDLINTHIVYAVARDAASSISAAAAPGDGDWSEAGNFVYLNDESDPPLPAPDEPKGYYVFGTMLNGYWGDTEAPAGNSGHLLTFTTGDAGELILHVHLIGEDEGELVEMKASLSLNMHDK